MSSPWTPRCPQSAFCSAPDNGVWQVWFSLTVGSSMFGFFISISDTMWWLYDPWTVLQSPLRSFWRPSTGFLDHRWQMCSLDLRDQLHSESVASCDRLNSSNQPQWALLALWILLSRTCNQKCLWLRSLGLGLWLGCILFGNWLRSLCKPMVSLVLEVCHLANMFMPLMYLLYYYLLCFCYYLSICAKSGFIRWFCLFFLESLSLSWI